MLDQQNKGNQTDKVFLVISCPPTPVLITAEARSAFDESEFRTVSSSTAQTKTLDVPAAGKTPPNVCVMYYYSEVTFSACVIFSTCCFLPY